jgi:hypothetical protein
MFNSESAKAAGRKSSRKGIPNQVDAKTKEILDRVLTRLLEDVEQGLDELKLSEKLTAVAKLLPYYLPKKSALDFSYEEPKEKIRPPWFSEVDV